MSAGLIVLDVDSTLITAEVIDLLAHRAGSGAEVAAVTESAMRGEIDFEESLHARVATLAGLPASAIDELRAEITLSPGAAELIGSLQAIGWDAALVSGGFGEVVAHLAADLGISLWRANGLEIRDGFLTGHTYGPVIDRAAKARALREFSAKVGAPRTVAVGDGANDLDMMAAADLSIAWRAKPTTRDAADHAIDVSLADALKLISVT